MNLQRKIFIGLLVLVTIVSVGCSTNSEAEIKLLNEEIERISSEVASQKDDIKSLLEIITEMKENNDTIEANFQMIFNDLYDESIKLDVKSTGYSILKNQFGSFPIIIDDLEETLTGYKLSVRIGNMTTSKFSDVIFHFVYPEELALSEQLLTPLRINIYTYTQHKNETPAKTVNLVPGGWTSVTFTLSNATLDELSNFYIVPEFNSISLSK